MCRVSFKRYRQLAESGGKENCAAHCAIYVLYRSKVIQKIFLL